MVVNEIRLFCGTAWSELFQLGDPAAVFKGPDWKSAHNFGGAFAGEDDQTQRCPDGEVAVGIHGRTGVWVDAIGLICDSLGRGRGFAEVKRRPPPVPLGRIQPVAAPLSPVPLGRKQPTAPQGPSPFERNNVPLSVILAPPPICQSAESARSRNSPAAIGLERQCQVAMEQAVAAARRTPPPPVSTSGPASTPLNNPPIPSGPRQPSLACEAAREARYHNSPNASVLEDQCRAQSGPYAGPTSYPPASSQQSLICDAARDARYYNSPDAYALENQCRVQGGGYAGPIPTSPYPAEPELQSPICDAARQARYFNYPEAYALENQCRAQGGSHPAPTSNSPYAPGQWQQSSICISAREALLNGAPFADRLEAICRAGPNAAWGRP